MREVPPDARGLAEPWLSLRASVAHLTPELEREFRFGQRVIELEGKYRLGGAIKGGSSAMWIPATREDFDAYRGWAALEAIPRGRRYVAFYRVRRYLSRRGVELRNGALGTPPGRVFSTHHGNAYGMLHRILGALPDSHVRPPRVRAIQLGGWGPDSAKASAYESGVVMLYDFALQGARRTFVGLLLHELGHAAEGGLDEEVRAELRRAHARLTAAGAFLGVEFLLDAESRRAYQASVFEEYFAETYMIYVSQGERLRRFIAGLPPGVRECWETAYARFVEVFGGIEYK